MVKKKLKNKIAPLPDIPAQDENSPEMDNEQTMNQKKIALAQSGVGPVLIEMMKDIMQKVPLIGNSEWETIKNAIIIDTSSTMLRDMVNYLEDIKKGSLIGKK